MSNKTACIFGSVLFFPSLYFWSYVFHMLLELDLDWVVLPTAIIGGVYLSLAGTMAFSGFFCWMNELDKNNK